VQAIRPKYPAYGLKLRQPVSQSVPSVTWLSHLTGGNAGIREANPFVFAKERRLCCRSPGTVYWSSECIAKTVADVHLLLLLRWCQRDWVKPPPAPPPPCPPNASAVPAAAPPPPPFADMTAKDTAKEHGHGWQLKEATAYQGHRIRQRLSTGAWRDFHENKIARLPYVRGPQQHRIRTHASTHARFATSRPRTRGGEQRKTEHSRTPLGCREWGGSAGGQTGPLAAPPRPRSLGCGRAAGTPLRGRFAHGEGTGHTHSDRTG
jgi:hypothetical protein